MYEHVLTCLYQGCFGIEFFAIPNLNRQNFGTLQESLNLIKVPKNHFPKLNFVDLRATLIYIMQLFFFLNLESRFVSRNALTADTAVTRVFT